MSFAPLTFERAPDVIIWRREHFDARFEILSAAVAVDGAVTKPPAVIDEQSDLVKGVYEGGLKTWECASDLVEYLANGSASKRVIGSSTFEVSHSACCTRSWFELVWCRWAVAQRCRRATSSAGCCMSSTLSMSQLRLPACISSTSTSRVSPERHQSQGRLADVPCAVLQLITVPNLLLAYAQHVQRHSGAQVTPTTAGELNIDAALVASFLSFLERHRIELRLFAGDWATMPPDAMPYDLVLSSETVYEPTALPSLVSVLAKATGASGVCLVACKRVYFGVGGGEVEFLQQSKHSGASINTVARSTQGVERVILSTAWPSRH